MTEEALVEFIVRFRLRFYLGFLLSSIHSFICDALLSFDAFSAFELVFGSPSFLSASLRPTTP